MKKTSPTALHPQSDGQIKRQHQTILFDEIYLRKSKRLGSVDSFISTDVQNIQTRNYWNPAEVYFVQDLPTDLLRSNLLKTEKVSSPENYLKKVKRKLEEIHEEGNK